MALVERNPPANAGDTRDTRDTGLIPGLGRSPGEGNGNPTPVLLPREFQDRGAWWATVHGVTQSRTRLSE